jgi:hypothetical protein
MTEASTLVPGVLQKRFIVFHNFHSVKKIDITDSSVDLSPVVLSGTEKLWFFMTFI